MFEEDLERITRSLCLLQTLSLTSSFPLYLVFSLSLPLPVCLNLPPPRPSLKNVEGPVIRMHAWLADERVYIAAAASDGRSLHRLFCGVVSQPKNKILCVLPGG